MFSLLKEKNVITNDRPSLQKVKGHDPKSWKLNISKMVPDSELVSTEDHYNVEHRLSKKLENLTFGDPERSRSLTEI